MRDKLLTDAELAAIAKEAQLLRDEISSIRVQRLLADLHRYRAWCIRLLRAYEGDDDIFALQAEVRAALDPAN